MTATKHFGLLSMVSLLAVIMLIGCGSDSAEFDPNAIPPSIIGLNRDAADIGQQVVVRGLRFGHSMSGSQVTLNGQQFQVQDTDWSDTELTVTVAQGMTSGIVVVEVDSLSSQSGSEAQLFIPTAPVGSPLISAISPDYGREPEFGVDSVVITITGSSFGDGTGDSGVYFTEEQAGATSQLTGGVMAPVVNVVINAGEDNEETVTQWTNSSIKVTVPNGSVSGDVYVRVNGVSSNGVDFIVLPNRLPGAPWIFPQSNTPPGLDPQEGSAFDIITISGENFGSLKGSSTVEIIEADRFVEAGSAPREILLGIINWASSELIVKLPPEIVTGRIRVTVGGEPAESEEFTAEYHPEILGVSPSILVVGQPLTVTGMFFGPEQGTDGFLQVGSTKIVVDSWSNTEILVAELPAFTYGDRDNVPITVHSDSPKDFSDTWNVSFGSALEVTIITPIPNQGEAGTTEFSLFVTVVGGSGNYRYTLTPDENEPNVTDPSTNILPMKHTYPETKVGQPTEFQTKIRVEDLDNPDEVTVNGPILYLVPEGQGVITAIEVLDFNNGPVPAPKNEMVYSDPLGNQNYLYHDFTFNGGAVLYGSALSELNDGGPVAGITRDMSLFMSGSPSAKPYGYRYAGSNGSIVRIVGLNLGSSGQIYLNANSADGAGGFQVPAGDLVPGSWLPESVDFYLPQDVLTHLSGKVAIVTPLTSVLSSIDLICSPYIRDFIPITPVPLDEQFSLTAYDLDPPVVAGMTGADTFFLFQVQANYIDPFSGGAESGPALLATPMPANPSGTQVTFLMSTIPATGTIEVLNGTSTQASFVDGTIASGDWQGFLWTGALSSGSGFTRANSGIFSEAFAFTTTGGSGPPPTDFWDISGTVFDNAFPSNPLPGIDVYIQDIGGTTPVNLTTTSNGAGEYIFTDLPGDQQYEVWCDDAAWTWPGPRPVPNTGVLTQDEVNINISANFV